jgi:acyl carrier protein
VSFQDRVRLVFVSTFGLADDYPVERLQYRDAEEWDSLGHMRLVVALEDEFAVELSPEQALAVDSYRAALEIVGDLCVDA